METEAEFRNARDIDRANSALVPLLGVLAAVIVLRFIVYLEFEQLATALMWAGSCLISGAAIGFLFGIPRVIQTGVTLDKSQQATVLGAAGPKESVRGGGDAGGEGALASDYRQQVNSNLVEISDWLTKIIVGLGLVNLVKIPEMLSNAATALARGLTATARCTGELQCPEYAFSLGLIVAFSILGFVMGYIYTRLFLAGAFGRADTSLGARARELNKLTERIVKEEGAAAAPIPSGDQRATVTPAQLKAAERVFEQSDDIAAAAAALRELAADYNEIRRKMIPGDTRTRRMEDIVTRMRALSLAAYDKLGDVASSDSPGERLAAIAILQVRPNPDYVEWLISRLHTEKPFIKYHAALALRRAVEEADNEQRLGIVARLQDWLSTERGRAFINTSSDEARVVRSLVEP